MEDSKQPRPATCAKKRKKKSIQASTTAKMINCTCALCTKQVASGGQADL